MPLLQWTESEVDMLADLVCKKLCANLLPALLSSIGDNNPNDVKRYMTTEEVAEKLQKQPRQINMYLKQLLLLNAAAKKPIELPFHKAGRTYRFDPTMLDKAVRCGFFSAEPRLNDFIKK